MIEGSTALACNETKNKLNKLQTIKDKMKIIFVKKTLHTDLATCTADRGDVVQLV